MKIKTNPEFNNYWITKFCYQVIQDKNILVTINSNRLLFKKEFLDYYAEACEIERESLTLKYTGCSLEVEF